MGFDRVWLPYLYLYGAGGVLFVAGLVMMLRSEAFQARRDRRWLVLLFFGFFYYAGLHLLGILIALAAAGEAAQ